MFNKEFIIVINYCLEKKISAKLKIANVSPIFKKNNSLPV